MFLDPFWTLFQSMGFFVVTEWFEEWPEATKELSNWIQEGKIKYRKNRKGKGFGESAPRH
ncbi:MAG: hypothetical protein CM1200mP12_15560 [Gammaproteobacteria bacterium]|nr:MAG: hypothetical protein CM1200mP12_15560 [Gammaproteobacteria bacterium]